MSVRIAIESDPAHMEGGHALIRFKGAVGPVGPAELCIAPLAEGAVYDGPRRIPVQGREEPDGVVYASANGDLDLLETGQSFSLSIAGSKLGAEVVWPSLPTLRLEPVRQRQRTTRTVVDPARRKVARQRPSDDDAQETEGTVAPTDVPKAEPKAEIGVSAGPGSRATVSSGSGRGNGQATEGPGGPELETIISRPEIAQVPEESKPEPGRNDLAPKPDEKLVVPPDREDDRQAAASLDAGKARGKGVLALIAAAVAGLAVGIAADRLLTPTPPAVEKAAPPDGTRAVVLPSPYDLLTTLPASSPSGKLMKDSYAVNDLFSNAFTSEKVSREEGRWWRRWAIRKALQVKDATIPTILESMGYEIARDRLDAEAEGAARLLWELAAVGNDCQAMRSIASALENRHDQEAGNPAIWRARAAACAARAGAAR